ncbi:DUF917 domain-containing protein [Hellea balneolensis]|uniref:DUF917 domain-containing protein n=1 Tax=Hellea balneolensis TaxID=287478 RepID=UPI000426D6AD|nr:DUF917 domain-containing protein [Hellea balneolensis]
MSFIGLHNLDDFAYGAAFMGTGGGGDPYLGKLFIRQALLEHGQPTIMDLADVSDEAKIFCVAMMGAPTILIEKMFSMEDLDLAVRSLENKLGYKADIIIPAEIGGVNATVPVAYAAYRGLPVLNADGMGRAFPSLEMVTFNIGGVSCTPMSLANEHGETKVIETVTTLEAEQASRPIITEWGGSGMISLYPMTGKQAKETAVAGTLSLAVGIGKAIREGNERNDAIESLLRYLRTTDYFKHCAVVFEGKIVDLTRKTQKGWNVGFCHLQALEDPNDRMEVIFQNEHLVAYRNGRVATIVPDLIAIVDSETAEPIATEALRYGQRVKVIGTSAAPIMRSPEALKVFGPKCFGLDEPFVPIEQLVQTRE